MFPLSAIFSILVQKNADAVVHECFQSRMQTMWAIRFLRFLVQSSKKKLSSSESDLPQIPANWHTPLCQQQFGFSFSALHALLTRTSGQCSKPSDVNEVTQSVVSLVA